MDLSHYKNIFGEVGKGPHSYRFLDIAIVDVLLTLLGAYFLSLYFKIPFAYMAAGLFLLGIFLHRLFDVRTTVDKLLFPR